MVISHGKWDSEAKAEDIQKAIDRFYGWYEQHLSQGTMKPGQRLAIDSRPVSKNSVTDRPFSEAKKVVGGNWFIVAGSIDEAAKIAADNPCLAYGLSLEIWPIDPEKGSAYAVTCETPTSGLIASA